MTTYMKFLCISALYLYYQHHHDVLGLLFTPTSSATPLRPNHIILTSTIAILITIVDRVITSYPHPDPTAAAPPFLNHFFDQRLSDLDVLAEYITLDYFEFA